MEEKKKKYNAVELVPTKNWLLISKNKEELTQCVTVCGDMIP